MILAAWSLLLSEARALDDCTVDTGAAVTFGWYSSSTGAPLDTAGSVVIDCTGIDGSPVTVALSAGGSGSFSPREMSRVGGGPAGLTYNLYRDAARTQIWGDGVLGGQTKAVTPTQRNEVVPVFGRVFAGQNVSHGTYVDSVLVTVSF